MTDSKNRISSDSAVVLLYFTYIKVIRVIVVSVILLTDLTGVLYKLKLLSNLKESGVN